MALEQGTLPRLTQAISDAASVVEALGQSQQQAGRPMSPPQVQLLQYHLEGLYASGTTPSQGVVNHAAAVLRAFSCAQPLPLLPQAAVDAATHVAQLKNALGAAAHGMQTGVKGVDGVVGQAPHRRSSRARGAAVKKVEEAVKKEEEEATPQPPAAQRKGKGKGRTAPKKEQESEEKDYAPKAAPKGKKKAAPAVKKAPSEEDESEDYLPKAKAAPKGKKRAAPAVKKAPSEEDESEDYAPKAKAAPKGKKRAATQQEPTDMDFLGSAMWPETPPAPQKSRSKYAKVTEETTIDDDGWVAYPPSILYKCPPATDPSMHCSKVAAFDVWNTLFRTKSGCPFPLNSDDWCLYSPTVPETLQSLAQQGYRICILNNQGEIKSALTGKASENMRARTNAYQEVLGVPLTIVAATQKDDYRKPMGGMWHFLCDHLSPNVKPDPSQSFYCGDASSPENEDGMHDRMFSMMVGIDYRDVKEVFGMKMQAGGGKVREPAPKLKAVQNNTGDRAVNTAIANLLLEKEKTRATGNKFESIAIKRSAQIVSEFPYAITNDEGVLKRLSDTKYIGKSTMQDVRAFVRREPMPWMEEASD